MFVPMDVHSNDSAAALLSALYLQWQGTSPSAVTALPKAGSDRQYFRLQGRAGSAIGVRNLDLAENKAFLSFSSHFRQCGLPVPAIYAVDDRQEFYLQQDLGDQSLLQALETQRTAPGNLPATVR